MTSTRSKRSVGMVVPLVASGSGPDGPGADEAAGLERGDVVLGAAEAAEDLVVVLAERGRRAAEPVVDAGEAERQRRVPAHADDGMLGILVVPAGGEMRGLRRVGGGAPRRPPRPPPPPGG